MHRLAYFAALALAGMSGSADAVTLRRVDAPALQAALRVPGITILVLDSEDNVEGCRACGYGKFVLGKLMKKQPEALGDARVVSFEWKPASKIPPMLLNSGINAVPRVLVLRDGVPVVDVTTDLTDVDAAMIAVLDAVAAARKGEVHTIDLPRPAGLSEHDAAEAAIAAPGSSPWKTADPSDALNLAKEENAAASDAARIRFYEALSIACGKTSFGKDVDWNRAGLEWLVRHSLSLSRAEYLEKTLGENALPQRQRFREETRRLKALMPNNSAESCGRLKNLLNE